MVLVQAKTNLLLKMFCIYKHCTKYLRSATFYVENTNYYYYKPSYLNEDNCTEPSPLVIVPRVG